MASEIMKWLILLLTITSCSVLYPLDTRFSGPVYITTFTSRDTLCNAANIKIHYHFDSRTVPLTLINGSDTLSGEFYRIDPYTYQHETQRIEVTFPGYKDRREGLILLVHEDNRLRVIGGNCLTH